MVLTASEKLSVLVPELIIVDDMLEKNVVAKVLGSKRSFININ
jgi:hypothetical protein